MTTIVTPVPTPVFANPDGSNAPTMISGWTAQDATLGSDQALEGPTGNA
jgi:hypothetical protein